jgi:hypothetical protein
MDAGVTSYPFLLSGYDVCPFDFHFNSDEICHATRQEWVRFELEFAAAPDRKSVDQLLRSLADRDVVRRVIDLMTEEGVA